MPQPLILLCTVGTGNVDQLRDTLLTPLTKSIQAGEWQRVILLPSKVTADNAAVLQNELAQFAIEIQPLPVAGAEDNADACFAHFDRVIEVLRNAGHEPQQILADFTRGTKAMSAALVLAAIRHELPQLRYLSGGRRDERGLVVPGTEIVTDIRTTVATARRRLDEAFGFLQRGNFAAVLDVLPDPASPFAAAWPPDVLEQASCVRPLARFYSAWDRLDYKGASHVDLVPSLGMRVAGATRLRDQRTRWDKFVPSAAVRGWVQLLAEDLPDDARTRAGRLRLLAADLLANGERRLRDHQFEDAIIRAYRVLDLVGQTRLCDQGIHSDDVPADHPIVQAFQDKLAKNNSNGLGRGPGGRLLASREQVARLLKDFKDPLAQRLLDLGNEGVVKASRRNYSALIHGFEAASGSDPAPLIELYDKLEKLLIADSGDSTADRLRLARTPDLSRS